MKAAMFWKNKVFFSSLGSFTLLASEYFRGTSSSARGFFWLERDLKIFERWRCRRCITYSLLASPKKVKKKEKNIILLAGQKQQGKATREAWNGLLGEERKNLFCDFVLLLCFLQSFPPHRLFSSFERWSDTTRLEKNFRTFSRRTSRVKLLIFLARHRGPWKKNRSPSEHRRTGFWAFRGVEKCPRGKSFSLLRVSMSPDSTPTRSESDMTAVYK